MGCYNEFILRQPFTIPDQDLSDPLINPRLTKSRTSHHEHSVK